MSSIYSWSTIAGDNELSDTAIDWREGQSPSSVNNSARAMMGRVAELLGDIGGTVTSTNVGNAYAVTANSAFSALAGGLIVAFIASATNTGPATLAVNGLSSKSLRRLGPTGADDAPLYKGQIRSGQRYVCRYATAADTGTGGWVVLNPSSPGFIEIDALSAAPVPVAGAALYADASGNLFHRNTTPTAVQITDGANVRAFPSGTRMMFSQAAAPTGWTQDITVNDRVLRVVSSAGNGDGGSWTISGVTVGSHALTVAELPVHTHSVSGTTAINTASHKHTFSGTTGTDSPDHTHTYSHLDFGGTGGSLGYNNASSQHLSTSTSGASVRHTHSFSGTTNVETADHNHTFSTTSGSAGSGSAHAHTIAADGAWRPAYRDVIIAAKD